MRLTYVDNYPTYLQLRICSLNRFSSMLSFRKARQRKVRADKNPIRKPGFWNIIFKEDMETNDGLSKQEILNSKNETKTPHLNNMKAQSEPHHIRHLVRYYFILHTVKY